MIDRSYLNWNIKLFQFELMLHLMRVLCSIYQYTWVLVYNGIEYSIIKLLFKVLKFIATFEKGAYENIWQDFNDLKPSNIGSNFNHSKLSKLLFSNTSKIDSTR